MSAHSEHSDKPRLVIGIGASAGGLAACRSFLAAMPPDSGVAIVAIMHLAPDRESHIAEIFRTSTAMTVLQAIAAVPVEPNHVYVIAPDSSLAIHDGVLYPNKPGVARERRHPVDAFFASLADDWGERAVGIVLSGTGDNGSVGIQDIKARGGLCMAQDPSTAEYADMPRNAIATGAIDHVSAPEAMPRHVLAFANGIEAAARSGTPPQKKRPKPTKRSIRFSISSAGPSASTSVAATSGERCSVGRCGAWRSSS
jgi:two-component system, chemotaxis family, CheB/CheR fusion protein